MAALGQKQPLSMLQILAPERLVSGYTGHSPLNPSGCFGSLAASQQSSTRPADFGGKADGPQVANLGNYQVNLRMYALRDVAMYAPRLLWSWSVSGEKVSGPFIA